MKKNKTERLEKSFGVLLFLRIERYDRTPVFEGDRWGFYFYEEVSKFQIPSFEILERHQGFSYKVVYLESFLLKVGLVRYTIKT